MDAKVRRKPGGFEVIISKELYEKEAVFAATYALSGLCRNTVEPARAGYVKVTCAAPALLAAATRGASRSEPSTTTPSLFSKPRQTPLA